MLDSECFDGKVQLLARDYKNYIADIRRHVRLWLCGPEERKRELIKEKLKGQPIDNGPLFMAASIAASPKQNKRGKRVTTAKKPKVKKRVKEQLKSNARKRASMQQQPKRGK